MAGRRVHFVMSEDLVGRIDAALDGESRGEFVRRAVEQALGGGLQRGGSDPLVVDDRLPDGESHPAPAPAEQPRVPENPNPFLDGRPRHGFVGPKRSVEPIPKGGKS